MVATQRQDRSVPGCEEGTVTAINTRRSSMIVVAGCRLAIAVPAVMWLGANDRLSFTVALIALFLTEAPMRLLRDPPLRDVTAAVTALLLAAHIVLGMYLALYELSVLYDKVMHVVGSGAVATILTLGAKSCCRQHRLEVPGPLIVLTVFAGTLSVGTLWEIFEFAIDRTGLFVAQRGLRDTMFDLVADALGATFALAIITVLMRSRAG